MKVAIDRFMAKVVWNGDPDECWTWEGANDEGYGRFKDEGKFLKAYQFSYEFFVGPIQDGLEPDHLCRNPRCVNPAHLEPVTHRVNVLRGNSPSALHAQKTHCQKGHPFQGANLRIEQGKRICVTCRRASARRSYRKRGKQ